MKTAILFDLDGTLLDTLEDLQDSVNYILAKYGYPLRSRSQIRQYLGSGARRLIEQALPENADVDAALAEYQEYYRAHCRSKTRPYDGIPEALEILRQKYPVAIVSNKPDAPVKLLCADYFPGIYARGESLDCPRKPAPDMVQKTMASLGVEACVYVGDSEVDVQTARNAGVPCLSVLWGFRDRPDMEAENARYFCDAPRQLPEMIEIILKDMEKENGK